MTEKFKEKDKVVLEMIVLSISDDGEVNTTWIENGTPKSGKFSSDVLTLKDVRRDEKIQKGRELASEWNKT
jgi:hypothetical protein